MRVSLELGPCDGSAEYDRARLKLFCEENDGTATTAGGRTVIYQV
jgi:hypothetical protein